ncbi:transcriptional regulator domain-containing protein [Paenirhodobacter populi]|nr:DUF6499 domain-containing protein [Sinirhodobacter populi]
MAYSIKVSAYSVFKERRISASLSVRELICIARIVESIAMLSIDWRSPAAYRHTHSIPAAGFAWDYLRRDDDYHRDFQKIRRMRKPAAQSLSVFSQQWGLRFPVRSEHSAGS